MKTAHSRRFAPASLLVACLSLALGVGLVAAPGADTPPAVAASPGQMIDFGGWTVGTHQLADGAFVYCVEPGAVSPYSAQHAAGIVEELRGYSIYTIDETGWSGPVSTEPIIGEPLMRINYVLSRYGSTEDADTAAAVQFAIWMLRGGAGEAAWVAHHVSWVEQHGGAGVIARARALADEAIAQAASAEPIVPDPLQIRLDGGHGEGVVEYPEGTTELRIEGAAFDDGSRVRAVSSESAGSLRWRADLHADGWQRSHPVSVSGSWISTADSWPAKLEVFPSEVPSEQNLVWAVGPVAQTRSGEFLRVEAPVDAQFRPVLSTEVPERWLTRDVSTFVDTVALEIEEGGTPWPERTLPDGTVEYLPVTADGVVYGPFNAPQQPAAQVPDGAPVAGTAVLRAEDGPGSYRVDTEERPDEAGYYYWVWSIREEDQDAGVRESDLLPDGYAFTDGFGLSGEGHVTPTSLRWSTELVRNELELDHLVLEDRVTVTLHHGAWLRGESGERIPARIRLSVFGSVSEPTRQPEVPAGAVEIATGVVEISAPNLTVLADPIPLPADTRGWVTVRACLFAEDQDPTWGGAIEEWCDDYGIAEETARIVEPAQPETPEASEELAVTGGHGVGIAAIAGAAFAGVAGIVLVSTGVRRRRV